MLLTRRQFLQTTAGLIALLAGGEYGNAAAASFGRPAESNTLVILSLKGGMDGLMAAAPLNDRYLTGCRPTLAMTGSMLALDGQFGLHPSLAPLLPLYQAGQLAMIHGVGSPDPSRFHSDAQYYLEAGTPGSKHSKSGWLNRADALLGGNKPLSLVSLTHILPLIMRGERPAAAMANIRDFSYRLGLLREDNARLAQSLQSMYQQSDYPTLQATAAEIQAVVEKLAAVQQQSLLPETGILYPNTAFGRAMRQLAMLIKADAGVRFAFVELEGWDTHIRQGTANGPFARQAYELALGMAGFWQDIGARQQSVVLATLTEFGRTVQENESGGTDHGRGSCSFLLGTQVAGGRVYGQIPELAPDNLAEGQALPVTTDFRAILAEIFRRHFRLTKYQAIFPGWEAGAKPLSLWKQ
ncbi:DUF1501 domain-containing protein [Acetonema longum]|uniref:DUF1501 domain-containing protein n=1 Tax=Acetonema longum DSM 6540 TaxID=1009370 RepID=F7NEM6_9FIRM|nr:DUF1501 domain-containing protein [Acetonema longum]EGO65437.1 hypothetical protein ALO_02446 [Acetonema longum DSM 6540]